MVDALGIAFGSPLTTVYRDGNQYMGFNSYSMNAASLRLAHTFIVDKAMTITHLGIRIGTVVGGTSKQYDLRLETVTATDGLDPPGTPTNTLANGSNSNVTITPATGGSDDGLFKWYQMTGSYSASVGDVLSVVLTPIDTPDGSNYTAFTSTFDGALGEGAQGNPHCNSYNGSTWVGGVINGTPCFGVKDGATATHIIGFPIQSFSLDAPGTNGHRSTMRFTIPTGLCSTFKLRGIRTNSRFNASGTARLGIWDSGGSLLGSTIDYDTDKVPGAHDSQTTQYIALGGTQQTLNAGSVYRIGFERVNIGVGFHCINVANANDWLAFPGISNFLYEEYTGSWSGGTATKRPICNLVFDDITGLAGAGSVGSSIVVIG